jgi:hypothetical protein
MYRGLGFDPVPGELSSVSQAVAQFRSAAEALADVAPSLRRAGELSHSWQGDAAEAFRARLRDTPGGLASRAGELRRAADVLDRWAETLLANKRVAEELDEQALRLRGRLRSAQDLLQDKQNARDLAMNPAAETEVALASTLVSDLESALDEVLAKARRLERDHLRAADAVANELASGTPTESEPAVARPAIDALARAASTANTLAGLLVPAGHAAAAPPRAAGALAAAIAASGGTTRR